MEKSLKTKKKPTKLEVVEPKKPLKSLSLDEIEILMDQYAQTECQSLTQSQMINDKMERLEKAAKFKFMKMQMKQLEQTDEPIETQPIEVKFITSKTPEQLERLERIENQVKDGRIVKQDA